MASPPVSELTDRARAIFRLVVEGYLDSGHPVGSRTLAEGGVNLSPASIRSVLSELEALGLLAAPHTSAGRMPTELGLRLVVDGMMQVAEPSPQERAAIERRLAEPGPIEAALEATSAVLSDISGAAGMVMVPRREPRLAQMNIVPLDQGRALAVLVGEDGSVENRLVTLDPGTTPSALIEAANYLNTHLRSRTLSEARAEIAKRQEEARAELDKLTQKLVDTGLAGWAEARDGRPETLIVRGRANLLEDVTATEDLERIRLLFDDLETQQELIHLLGNAETGEGVRIFIGSENQLFSLSGSSLVVSPYRDSDQRIVGVLGVIGPTRLNYARIVPMVDYTAKVVSQLIR